MNKKSFGSRLNAAPYLVWMLIFIIVPLLMVIYYAFTNAGGAPTLSNVRQLLRYTDTFGISLLYAFIATAICLIAAYPFAYFYGAQK